MTQIILHNQKNGKERKFRHENDAELFLDNARNPQDWKRIVVIVFIIALMVLFCVYYQGLNQGSMRTALTVYSNDCEKYNMTPIYPYGCEHNDLKDTHCIVMDCKSITPFGDWKNAALCIKFNLTVDWRTKTEAYFTTMALTGCPGRLEEIGINPKTGNRNWWIKD